MKKWRHGGGHVLMGAENTKGCQQPRASESGEDGVFPGASGGAQPSCKPEVLDLRLVASSTVRESISAI